MQNHPKISTPMLASIGAGMLIIVLIFSYLLSSGLMNRREGVTLPTAEQDTPVISSGGQVFTAQSVAEVQITSANAQKVIASLKRPEAYSCHIENTLYYQGGSSSLYCDQYVQGDAIRTDTVSASGAVQSTLLRKGDKVYAWNFGDTKPYEGSWGSFSNDAAAMLPTYEDVLSENLAITEAGRTNIEQDPCIHVVFEQDGYRCVYDISAATGLLRQAAYYSGDTLGRLVKVTELKTEQPEDDYFTLPNGTSILGES